MKPFALSVVDVGAQLACHTPFCFEPSRIRWFCSHAARARRSLTCARLAESTLLVTGLARNCAATLPKHIRLIERLHGCFRRLAVHVVENDSTDITKEVLAQWRARSPHVTIDSRNLGLLAGKGGFSAERIDRMTASRNRYLDFLAGMPWIPDYVLVLDFDVFHVAWSGLLDAFNDIDRWDVLCANGLSYRHGGSFSAFRGFVCYDTYALRTVAEGATVQTVAQLNRNRDAFAGLCAGDAPVEVSSAFGGAALYRSAALRAGRYRVLPNVDPAIPVLCEHVALHRELAAAGYGRVALHPSMLVTHGSPWRFLHPRHKGK